MIPELSEVLEYPATTITGPVSFRRAWWAVVARFLIHGLAVSTWVSRIPSVKAALHLGDGVFGVYLFGTAVGSVIGIPVAGWCVTRYGSRQDCVWTSVGLCLALALPAVAINATSLFAALLIFGLMLGGNDVAMNSQAVSVEKLMGTRTMSRFHAMFSVGGIVGAAGGGWIASHGVSAGEHLAVMSAIFFALSLATAPLLMEAAVPAETRVAKLRFRNIPAPLLVLCAIGFCIFLSEGAIADWTAIYLRQVLNAGPGLAAMGYAVFSAAMAVFRLCGDWITNRLGFAWTVRGGALVAALGLASALLVHSPYQALPGFALVGAGFSSIIPLVFAAGGRIPSVSDGTGVAAVSGLGYLGFLIGPTAIGFLSELTSLRVGMSLLVLLSLLAASLVGRTASGPTGKS
jgi:MFS family permease